MSNKSIYYAGWRYCHPVAMWADVRPDLVTPGLQPLEAALAVQRDAELADVREELHDLGVSGARSLVTVLSARRKCCEDTHHSEQARQSERERNRSLEVTAPSLIPCPAAGSSVSQESRDTSLVQICQRWSLIGQKKEAWVYVLWLWPSLKWSFRNSEKN